jgi:hypothetical protein
VRRARQRCFDGLVIRDENLGGGVMQFQVHHLLAGGLATATASRDVRGSSSANERQQYSRDRLGISDGSLNAISFAGCEWEFPFLWPA